MIELLTSPIDPAALDSLFALCQRCFPGSVLRSESSLRRSFATPAYRVLLARTGNNVTGLSILYAPPSEPFALLEYLAVDPTQRSQGIGTQLFEASAAAVADRHVLIEAESETDDPRTRRRLDFYRRLGCQRIEKLIYQLPLPGDPPPMDLLIRLATPVAVSRADLAHWLRLIYGDVYECDQNDRRINEMMSTVSDPVAFSPR